MVEGPIHIIAGFDLGKVRRLIALAKRQGVKSLTIGDFNVELYPPAAEMSEVDLTKILDPTQNPASEDEVLFWSAGGSGLSDTKGEAVVPPLVGEDRG